MAHGIRSFSGTPDIHRNISVVKPKLKHWFGNISYIFFQVQILIVIVKRKEEKTKPTFGASFGRLSIKLRLILRRTKRVKGVCEPRTEPNRAVEMENEN